MTFMRILVPLPLSAALAIGTVPAAPAAPPDDRRDSIPGRTVLVTGPKGAVFAVRGQKARTRLQLAGSGRALTRLKPGTYRVVALSKGIKPARITVRVGRRAGAQAYFWRSPGRLAGGTVTPGITRITAPRRDHVVAPGESVRVRLRTARRAKVTLVAVNGVPLRKRLDRGSRIHRFTVDSSDGLRPGRNTIGVSTAKGRRADFDQVRVWVAAPSSRLLSLSGPKKRRIVSGPVRVRLTTARRLDVLTARLNGRDVLPHLTPRGPRARRATLSASHGLKQGRNRLVVTAIRNSTVQRIRRTIVLDGTRPLAGAGTDVSTTVGRAVVFGGRSLPPSRKHKGTTYSWRMVAAPRGSTAGLTRSRAKRPALVPDVPGRYRIRLRTAHAGSVSTADDVIVNASSAITVPLSTQARGPAGTIGVQLGEQFYPGPVGSTPQVQALIVDRATAEVTDTATIPSGSRGLAALRAVMKTAGTNIVILSGAPGAALLTPKQADDSELLDDMRQVFDSFGSDMLSQFNAAKKGIVGPFSLISVPAAVDEGFEAYQSTGAVGTGGGGLTGHLTRTLPSPGNPTENFAFAFSNLIPFSLRDGVTLGTTSYPQPLLPPGVAGGFHVLVLSRFDLSLQSEAFYATNSADPMTAISDLGRTLSAAADSPASLVVVASVGSPAPTSFAGSVAQAWTTTGRYIEQLGGTRDVFLRLRGADTYSLVGFGSGRRPTPLSGYANPDPPPVAEASSRISPDLGALSAKQSGVLTPDNNGLLGAQIASAGDTFNYDLAPIAYQPASAWPYSTSAAQKAANAYIAAQLDDDLAVTVRNYYTDTNLPWQGWSAKVAAMAYPPDNSDFSKAVFDQVKSALSQEMLWVSATQSLFANLSSVFDVQGTTSTQINAVAQAINGQFDPKQNIGKKSTAAEVLSVIGNALTAISRIDPELAPVGALGSAFAAGSNLATTGTGAQIVKVDGPAADLAEDLSNALVTQQYAIGTLGRIILVDHDKLQKVAALAAGEYAWTSGQTTPEIRNGLVQGAAQTAWSSLLPVAFAAWTPLWTSGRPWADARNAHCQKVEFIGTKTKHPWADLPTAAQGGQAILATRVSTSGAVSGLTWAWGSGEPQEQGGNRWVLPDEAFTESLIRPATSPPSVDSAGLYLPWLLSRHFEPVRWQAQPDQPEPYCPELTAPPG